MGKRIAVVVVVDGLRADGLGCYGNARAQTPFLDRLAAESVVFDFAYCLDPTLESFYGSAVGGIHPAYRHVATSPAMPPQPAPSSLLESARHLLFTDDPAVAALQSENGTWCEQSTIAGCGSRQLPAGGTVAPDGALATSATGAAFKATSEPHQFFQTAAEWLNDRFHSADDTPIVAWVHASLLTRRPRLDDSTSTAPELRQAYDELVTSIDAGIRTLFADLSFPDDASDILFIVVGARGVSLGEPRGKESGHASLHEEVLHIPLIVHTLPRRTDPCRIPLLVSPLDLQALVLGWSRGELHDFSPNHMNHTGAETAAAATPRPGDWLFFATAQGDRAIRTPGWFLIQPSTVASVAPGAETQAASPLLYLKPDDRWECNEVLGRRPEIAADLSERLQTLQNQAAAGASLTLPPLSAELVKGG